MDAGADKLGNKPFEVLALRHANEFRTKKMWTGLLDVASNMIEQNPRLVPIGGELIKKVVTQTITQLTKVSPVSPAASSNDTQAQLPADSVQDLKDCCCPEAPCHPLGSQVGYSFTATGYGQQSKTSSGHVFGSRFGPRCDLAPSTKSDY